MVKSRLRLSGLHCGVRSTPFRLPPSAFPLSKMGHGPGGAEGVGHGRAHDEAPPGECVEDLADQSFLAAKKICQIGDV